MIEIELHSYLELTTGSRIYITLFEEYTWREGALRQLGKEMVETGLTWEQIQERIKAELIATGLINNTQPFEELVE